MKFFTLVVFLLTVTLNGFAQSPTISQNSGATTSSVCSNGTAVLAVTASPGLGGSLSYSWEASTDGGSSWNVITEGGNFSGTTTSSLSIINPVNGDKYRSTVTETPGELSATSSAFTLSVSPVSVGGTIAGSAAVCSGTNSTTLTLSDYTGSIIRWELSKNNFSTKTNIANTTNTLTATNLTATTQYRAVIQSGVCAVENSSVGTVTVNATAGGYASAPTSVCYGSSFPVVLKNSVGSVLKWQSSTDDFTSVITDIANTTTNLTVTNLTVDSKYRAVVQFGSCAVVISVSATVTVNPPSVGGTVSGSATVCSGTNSTSFTLSGYDGSVVRWESSTNNFISKSNIVNTTTSLIVTNLTATTYYRAVVKNGSCANDFSTKGIVTVTPVSVGGTIAGSTSVCSGTNSATLTLSGHTGIVVKWQESTDNFSSVITDIANTTTSLTATNLAATTKYRAVVQNGSCASVNSAIATVTVSPVSVGGSIAGATVCTGTNSTTLTLTDHTGAVVRWQSSVNNFSTVTNIVNTTTSLTATNLTATTQYRAVVQSGSCTSVNSAAATVAVSPVSVGGTIAGSATVCPGTNSTTFTLSGYTGSIVKWQSSLDNFSTVDDIINTTTSLTATNLTSTTQFRAVIESGSCASVNSSTATVTVTPVSVGGIVAGSATACPGTNSTTLTLSGHTGAVVKWQSSTDDFSAVVTDIANTSTSLTATNLVVATGYRAVVSNGGCTSANSTTATVTIAPVSVGGTIAGSATECSGTNSTTLTLSGQTGSVVKWQSSSNNFSTVTDINNTTTVLTATNLTTTTQYRAVVQNGGCASANSSTATITITPTSAAGTIAGGATVCSGTNSTNLTLSDYTGSIVKWQFSTDNFGSTILDIANTTTTLTVTNLTTTTQYRAVVQNGSCASATSAPTSVTVVTGQWVGGSSGDWNNPANWCGGIPTSSTDISIPANSTVYLQSDNGVVNSVTIAANASVVMTGSYNLAIAAGGTFTNYGTFDASGSTGAVSFLGNGTVIGTTTFQNIETFGALDPGSSSTIAGELTLQPGGSLTGNSPTYQCPGSTLTYNTGGTYSRGMEWTSASAGQGLPSNVKVKNNTTIDFPAAGNGSICNDLTIETGSAISQNFAGGSAPLTIGRNVTISGDLSLGSSSGGDISVGGNWTRNSGGTFTPNNRTVTFNSAYNSVITAPASGSRDANGAFGGETFYNIMVNKAASTSSVTLGSNISVTNELKLTQGIFDVVNSDVAIVSTAASTAHIASIPASGVEVRYGGAGGAGTGRFSIQRQLSIGSSSTSRRWRLLTAPIQASGAPSINAAWQEGVSNSNRAAPVDPWPGFGTTITKSATYNAADGFDQGSTESPSLYYYSVATGWTPVTSTLSTKVTDQDGYMIFARGSRSVLISGSSVIPGPTVLEAKGKINTGDVQKTLVAGYKTIGNPYASAINFSTVTFDNYTSGGVTYNNVTPGSAGGVGINYYIWDPNTGTGGTGKLILCSSNGNGTYAVAGNASGLPTDGTIQSGVAFMIAADNAGGTITFHETSKLSSSGQAGIASRTANITGSIASLTTNLLAVTAAGPVITDGVINAYHPAYLNEVNGQDALRLATFNTKEGLSIVRKNKLIGVERRNVITTNDTTFLHILNMNKTNYQFQFIGKNLDPSLTAFLEDQFTGLSKPIKIVDTTYIPFSITSDVNSSALNRFRIVFKPAAVAARAINSTVTATRHNNNVAVQWKVENELNIKAYEVEKSSNGADFTKVYATTATGNASTATYSWIDANIAAVNNFYRIKNIRTDGSIVFGKIVNVEFENGKSGFSLLSNPVTDGKVGLKLNNVAEGTYQVRIINGFGQVMGKSIVTHLGGSSTQVIPARILSKGIYNIEVSGPGNITSVLKVMVLKK